MGTIESRLAALEKLYADKSLELATCRLDVAVLQDLFIIWQRIVTGEDASALEGLVEKLLPSEPTSAAARQLLGLPVRDVWMQEDEPTDAPIDWLQATHTVSGKPVYDLALRPQGDLYGRVGDKADNNALRWFATTGRCVEAPFSGSDLRKPDPVQPQTTAADDIDPFPKHPKRGESVNFKIEVMATVVAREPDHIWVTVPGEEGGPDRLQKWEWSKTHRGPTLSQLSHLLEADADPT